MICIGACREELEEIRVRAIEALCLVERHLSVVELDIKLRALIHMVDMVLDHGEGTSASCTTVC